MVSLVSAQAALPPPARVPHKSLKRDSSHLSSPSAHDSLLSSQAKRLKVAFDDNIDVRVMEDWNSKPLELVREEVRLALESHLRRGEDKDDSAYEQLRMIFIGASSSNIMEGAVRDIHGSAVERSSSSLLKKYITALTGRTGDLKACGKIVLAVLDINWVGRDESFITLYVRFLAALGSAVPGFMRTILEKIVRHFIELPGILGRIPQEAPVSRQQMNIRLHNVLRYLLRLIPSASSGLSETLRTTFPNHKTESRQAYIGYVKNALHIIEYAPELKAEVLTLITERLVKIDVEVQEEIDDLEDEVEKRIVLNDQSTLDEFDDDESDTDSVSSSELSVSAEEQHIRALEDVRAKLDDTLDLLFSHYTPLFAHGKIYEVNEVFEHLVAQFTTFVLPTYRSRHTQFLIFHFAQTSQGHAERFALALAHIAMARTSASHGAVSAAAYLASFIARGARVSKPLIREIVGMLSAHLDHLRKTYEPGCAGPNLGRYALFYAITQALLYIFCFRWRDFVWTADGTSPTDHDFIERRDHEWIPEYRSALTQAIYCKLNPLKVCSPVIVNQFAAIATYLRFLFVIPLIETNKRLRLSSFRSLPTQQQQQQQQGQQGQGSPQQFAGSRGEVSQAARDNTLTNRAGEAHCQLDAFFPFDPFQLPKSKRWLEGDYLVWKPVPGMEDEDEDEDEDESSSDEDEEEDEEEVKDDMDVVESGSDSESGSEVEESDAE